MARSGASAVRSQPNEVKKSKVQTLTNSSATILSVTSANPPVYVKRIHLCESSGNATTATLRLVKSGGTDDATSNFVTAIALAANETVTLEAGGDGDYLVLEGGDALKGLASVTARINAIVVYDLEI